MRQIVTTRIKNFAKSRGKCVATKGGHLPEKNRICCLAAWHSLGVTWCHRSILIQKSRCLVSQHKNCSILTFCS